MHRICRSAFTTLRFLELAMGSDGTAVLPIRGRIHPQGSETTWIVSGARPPCHLLLGIPLLYATDLFRRLQLSILPTLRWRGRSAGSKLKTALRQSTLPPSKENSK